VCQKKLLLSPLFRLSSKFPMFLHIYVMSFFTTFYVKSLASMQMNNLITLDLAVSYQCTVLQVDKLRERKE
jgi:hypothetical protein